LCVGPELARCIHSSESLAGFVAQPRPPGASYGYLKSLVRM